MTGSAEGRQRIALTADIYDGRQPPQQQWRRQQQHAGTGDRPLNPEAETPTSAYGSASVALSTPDRGEACGGGCDRPQPHQPQPQRPQALAPPSAAAAPPPPPERAPAAAPAVAIGGFDAMPSSAEPGTLTLAQVKEQRGNLDQASLPIIHQQ